MFKDGWTNVHDEEQSGRHSEVSDESCSKCWSKNLWNTAVHNFRAFVWISTNFTHCSLRDYHSQTRLSQVLRNVGSENAHGCAQNAENGFSFDILEWYHKDCNEFFSHIIRVTGDETWVSFLNVETKEQSKQSYIYLVFSVFTSRPTSLLVSIKVSVFFIMVSILSPSRFT
jgi:hypothetical protein